MKNWKLLSLVLAGGIALLALGGTPARTADHRDAPEIQEDPAMDPLDVFVFRNPNNGNTVLAMTVAPFLIAGTLPVPFSPNGLYEFKIDNTGDAQEDLTLQVVFSQTPTTPFGPLAGGAPAQTMTVLGPARPTLRGATSRLHTRSRRFSGPANGTVFAGVDGMRGFAGTRDDPFFIDLVFVLGIVNGRPISRAPGRDAIAGLNCLTLAVEVPPALLTGANNTIRVWGSTSRPQTRALSVVPARGDLPANNPFFTGERHTGTYNQVDATALPVINTVFIPFPIKTAFNKTAPKDQAARFRAAANTRVAQILGQAGIVQLLPAGETPEGRANVLTGIVFPDVSGFDTSSNAGFLNGRRPQDDIADAMLQILTGNPAVNDAVAANDSAFLPDFPFFGVPHGAGEAIPPR